MEGGQGRKNKKDFFFIHTRTAEPSRYCSLEDIPPPPWVSCPYFMLHHRALPLKKRSLSLLESLAAVQQRRYRPITKTYAHKKKWECRYNSHKEDRRWLQPEYFWFTMKHFGCEFLKILRIIYPYKTLSFKVFHKKEKSFSQKCLHFLISPAPKCSYCQSADKQGWAYTGLPSPTVTACQEPGEEMTFLRGFRPSMLNVLGPMEQCSEQSAGQPILPCIILHTGNLPTN